MTNSVESFRLSFNLPSQRMFFDERTTKALRITVDETNVLFKPVESTRSVDSVRVEPRKGGRGGYEVTIQGIMADDLLEVLMRKATASRPFFLLSRFETKGWVGIEHFDSDRTPSKTLPHMRLWVPPERMEASLAMTERVAHRLAHGMGSIIQMATVIHEAQRVINGHASERRVGRPTREVQQARETLESFERLAAEILPHRFDGGIAVRRNLITLKDMLDKAISTVDSQVEVPRINTPTLLIENIPDAVITPAQTATPARVVKPAAVPVVMQSGNPDSDKPPHGTRRKAAPALPASKPAAPIRRVSRDTVASNVRSFLEAAGQTDFGLGESTFAAGSTAEPVPTASPEPVVAQVEIPVPVEQPMPAVPEIVPLVESPPPPVPEPVSEEAISVVAKPQRQARPPILGRLTLASLAPGRTPEPALVPVLPEPAMPEPAMPEPIVIAQPLAEPEEPVAAPVLALASVAASIPPQHFVHGVPDYVQVDVGLHDLMAERRAHRSGSAGRGQWPGHAKADVKQRLRA